jgi:ubiquinone/menaquinone biosynthesis C-methylase UbiE
MMGRQAQAFLSGEGAAWLKRNIDKLPVKNDPVIMAILSIKEPPNNILEIGCANGWRLKMLTGIYPECGATGVDPVIDNDHMEDRVILTQGTAERLRFFPNTFDMVIFGWCLYLCDPEDYFKIAAEADRVLAEDGYLIIYDFFSESPYAKVYKHKKDMYSYKMNFAKLWLSHPGYREVTRDVNGYGDDKTAVLVLQKHITGCFPIKDD